MNDLLLRRRIAIINSTPSLPYDAEVEYLESSGGARIVTDYVPNGDGISVNAKIQIVSFPSGSSNNGLFGAQTGGTYVAYRLIRNGTSYDTFAMNCNSKATGGSFLKNVGQLYSILWTIQLYSDATKQYCVLNNTECSGSKVSGSQNTGPFCIGAVNATTTNYTNEKIYYFNVYNNGVLVLDLIPVRIGQVGYMYDTVSGQLFGNAGTGNFTLGNDVN